jgi:superfamily I DNA/RNA helicase
MNKENPLRRLQEEMAALREGKANKTLLQEESIEQIEKQNSKHEKITKVYGPPGTGKTTFLINAVRDALQSGVSPHEIGYFSFTNKATEEAKTRMAAEFPSFSIEEDFPGFRTLHSLAFQALPNRTKIMTGDEALAFDSGFLIETQYMKENDPTSLVYRAKQIVVDAAATARARLIDFEAYLRGASESERYRLNRWLGYPAKQCKKEFSDLDIQRQLAYNAKYEAYKNSINAIDYTSILEEAINNPSGIPGYELLIIDEAQDLSLLQWKLARLVIDRSNKVLIAGDDDQAICESFGASANAFLSIEGHEHALTQSHRVPSKIHAAIFSPNGIISTLSRRYARKEKQWKSKDHADGSFQHLLKIDPLLAMLDKDRDDWLIMAATHSTLMTLSNILKERKIAHFLSNQLIASTENNTEYPTIRLMTIWGAKGGEAKNAVLLRGSYADENMLGDDPRLVYVAITRAKENFYVCTI